MTLKRACLHLLCVMLTTGDNLNASSLVQYLMQPALFDVLLGVSDAVAMGARRTMLTRRAEGGRACTVARPGGRRLPRTPPLWSMCRIRCRRWRS